MSTNTALIWNGFTHRWREENHRMARIGNRVRVLSPEEVKKLIGLEKEGLDENADFNYEIVHTAASGSEADTADYKSYFTSIQSPSERILFISGENDIHIRGAEDRLNYGQVNIFGFFKPFDQSIEVEGRFLLNGFDVVRTSNQEAKKFHKMNIHFSNKNIDPIQGFFSATINASLHSTCQSAECWGFLFGGKAPPGEKQQMEYIIRVSWVFAIGDKEELRFEDKSYSQNMSWLNKDFNFKPESHFMDNFIRQDKIAIIKDYPLMCPAYTSLSYFLTKEGGHIHQLPSEKSFHMLEFSSYLKPTLGLNNYTLEYLMFFKNWKKKMEHWSAYGVAGTANFNIGVCLMHFRNSETIIRNQERSGNFRWETKHGDNADPNKEEATQSHYFHLNNISLTTQQNQPDEKLEQSDEIVRDLPREPWEIEKPTITDTSALVDDDAITSKDVLNIPDDISDDTLVIENGKEIIAGYNFEIIDQQEIYYWKPGKLYSKTADKIIWSRLEDSYEVISNSFIKNCVLSLEQLRDTMEDDDQNVFANFLENGKYEQKTIKIQKQEVVIPFSLYLSDGNIAYNDEVAIYIPYQQNYIPPFLLLYDTIVSFYFELEESVFPDKPIDSNKWDTAERELLFRDYEIPYCQKLGYGTRIDGYLNIRKNIYEFIFKVGKPENLAQFKNPFWFDVDSAIQATSTEIQTIEEVILGFQNGEIQTVGLNKQQKTSFDLPTPGVIKFNQQTETYDYLWESNSD